MREAHRLVIAACFAAFLGCQVAALALGLRAGTFENRRLAELPEWSWQGFSENRTPEALSAFVRDRLPLRPALITAHNWAVFTLLGDSPVRDVRIGREGWLFLAHTIEAWPCAPAAEPRRLARRYDRFAEAARASGRTPLIVLSPDKATTYPEFLAERDRRRLERCAEPHRAVLERHFEADDRAAYVNLWKRWRDEKERLLGGEAKSWQEERLRYLFRPRDRHWHVETARLQAAAIADALGVAPQARATWPRISPEYELGPCEMSRRFLKFELPEPYARLGAPPAEVSLVELPIAGADHPVREFRNVGGSADPRRVVLIHDSFVEWSDTFLAASFARMDAIHWSVVRRRLDAVRERILAAEVVVLQAVDSHRGFWSDELPRLAQLLRAPPRAAESARRLRSVEGR